MAENLIKTNEIIIINKDKIFECADLLKEVYFKDLYLDKKTKEKFTLTDEQNGFKFINFEYVSLKTWKKRYKNLNSQTPYYFIKENINNRFKGQTFTTLNIVICDEQEIIKNEMAE